MEQHKNVSAWLDEILQGHEQTYRKAEEQLREKQTALEHDEAELNTQKLQIMAAQDQAVIAREQIAKAREQIGAALEGLSISLPEGNSAEAKQEIDAIRQECRENLSKLALCITELREQMAEMRKENEQLTASLAKLQGKAKAEKEVSAPSAETSATGGATFQSVLPKVSEQKETIAEEAKPPKEEVPMQEPKKTEESSAVIKGLVSYANTRYPDCSASCQGKKFTMNYKDKTITVREKEENILRVMISVPREESVELADGLNVLNQRQDLWTFEYKDGYARGETAMSMDTSAEDLIATCVVGIETYMH